MDKNGDGVHTPTYHIGYIQYVIVIYVFVKINVG